MPHMLSGKAVSRAIRGHLLVAGVLSSLMMAYIFEAPLVSEMSEVEENVRLFPGIDDAEALKEISQLFDEAFSGTCNERDLEMSPHLLELQEKIGSFKKTLSKSKTVQLWFQYLDLVCIMQKSIKAQRTGNWMLHLESLSEMLPFFAASGHHFYAKSGYAYLQSMQNLEVSNSGVFHHFNSGGLHVIRRSDRYWAGISSDMFIEQVLMRSIKTTGGLTRGKGVGELQRTVWLLSKPICGILNEAIQSLCGVEYTTSEQHKETTCSRRTRDYNDAVVIAQYIVERDPFQIAEDLVSIETGEVSAQSDVYLAKEIGERIIHGMEGKDMEEYSYSNKAKCKLMSSDNELKVDDDIVPVDPQLLFQRMSLAVSRDNSIDIKAVFQYELSTLPASLFSEKDGLMREADKAQLSTEIWEYIDGAGFHSDLPGEIIKVIDGDYLLHRIQNWPKGKTFSDISSMYVSYVNRNFGSNSIVVLDGGYDKPLTKDSTHLRRTKFKKGKEVNFSANMKLSMKREDFLLNGKNKQAFLEHLSDHLNQNGIVTIQSSGDADYDIVRVALRSSEQRPTVLIGEDTDLLCLLLHHATDNHQIYLTSEQKPNMAKPKFWSIQQAKKQLGEGICGVVLLIHAISGCDTTSRVFGIGKPVAFKKALNDSEFLTTASIFNCRHVSLPPSIFSSAAMDGTSRTRSIVIRVLPQM